MRGLYANIIASSYQQAAPPSIVTTNLTNYLDFSNASCYSGSGSTVNDLVDSLSYNIQGATFLSAVAGGSFSFDGINDYIVSNGVRNLVGAMTVGTWVYVLAYDTGNNQCPFCFEDSNTDGYRHLIDRIGDNFQPRYNGSLMDGVLAASTGTWYYYVSTIDASGNCKIYVNGSLDKSETKTAMNVTIEYIVLGQRSNGLSSGQGIPFHGWMGEVHWYDAELNATDVLTNFNATKTRYGY